MCVTPLNGVLNNNSRGEFCYVYSTIIKKMGKKILHDFCCRSHKQLMLEFRFKAGSCRFQSPD